MQQKSYQNKAQQTKTKRKTMVERRNESSVGTDKDPLECFSKFHVENSVDNGIDKRVDVTEPSGQQKGCHSRLAIHTQFGTNGVHYITSEKWHPADEENGCKFN